MPSRQWSLGRILLIWASWPSLLIATFFALTWNGWGFSLDLLHASLWHWLLFVAFLLGPPLLATVTWGRR